ncbi:MAG: sulfatase [Candidatus Methanomethylicaceae archaeon]
MRRPNILLIVLDATRCDYCSCYGFKSETTPALDKLAAEGILYEQAVAPAPQTLPAFASLFTGLFPSQTNIYTTRYLDSKYETLARILRRYGYHSLVISNNSWLSTDFGLVKDFNTVHKLWQLVQTEEDITSLNAIQRFGTERNLYLTAFKHYFLKPNAIRNMINYAYYRLTLKIDKGASRVLEAFKKWVSRQNSPWFAVIHYMEAHLPYRPPRVWMRRFARNDVLANYIRNANQQRMFWRHNAGIERLTEDELEAWRDLYAAEVRYQDYHLGQLIDWVRASGQYDSTCVIVVGDHGENLGEHGLLNHQFCLYETLIHVPLVIRYPAVFAKGERVQTLVSTLDIFKTVLDVVGASSPEVESWSLIPGSPMRSYVVSEYGMPGTPSASILAKFDLEPRQLKRFERGLTALRTERYKLIVGTDGTRELYDLQSDPDEAENLAEREPTTTQHLLTMLQGWWREHSTGLIGQTSVKVADVDPSVVERLRALGYLD